MISEYAPRKERGERNNLLVCLRRERLAYEYFFNYEEYYDYLKKKDTSGHPDSTVATYPINRWWVVRFC